MPAEIDGSKAIFGREPAWWGGKVFGDLMTAEQCLAVLNPTGKAIRKSHRVVGYFFDDEGKEQAVEADDKTMLIDFDSDVTDWRYLSVMGKDVGLIQREQQFELLDSVIGAIHGAHYEAAVNMRKGRQTALTALLGEYVLDPGGIADKQKKYLWAFNSWDGTLALRLKFGSFRVVCANTQAMALRGSTDKNVVGSDWSTRHTANVMDRVQEAAKVLGLWKEHDTLFQAQSEHMIHCQLDDNAFGRIIEGLFTTENSKTHEMETDTEAVATVRMQKELSASSRDIADTVWGGFNVITEYNDWVLKSKGSKNMTANDNAFVRVVEDPKGLKQRAWNSFWDLAADIKPFKMPDLV